MSKILSLYQFVCTEKINLAIPSFIIKKMEDKIKNTIKNKENG